MHLDIKKLGRFRRVGHRIHGDHGRRSRGSGSEYLPIAIDDRTRLAFAARFPDESAASATAFLRPGHRWFAARGVRIQALPTDNGSAYHGRVFGALCGQLGLRHHWTRPYSPQTNGKAERFIRTCLAEWAYQRAYPTSVARATRSRTSCDTTTSGASAGESTGSLPCSDLLSIGEQRLHQLQLVHEVALAHHDGGGSLRGVCGGRRPPPHHRADKAVGQDIDRLDRALRERDAPLFPPDEDDLDDDDLDGCLVGFSEGIGRGAGAGRADQRSGQAAPARVTLVECSLRLRALRDRTSPTPKHRKNLG